MPPLQVSAELIGEAELGAAPRGIDRILPSFSRLQAWWDGVLGGIRARLPAPLAEKVSDWLLTGILAATVVAALLTAVLLSSQPARQVAEGPAGAAEKFPEAPQVPQTLEAPPELTAPGRPEPVAFEPPPQPELTPEQSLIAAIEAEVADITRQSPQASVLSLEADFSGSRLTAILEERWYELSPKRQDKLANTLWQRARDLDFRKLELTDSQGTLVARSPVVGEQMVILHRRQGGRG